MSGMNHAAALIASTALAAEQRRLIMEWHHAPYWASAEFTDEDLESMLRLAGSLS